MRYKWLFLASILAFLSLLAIPNYAQTDLLLPKNDTNPSFNKTAGTSFTPSDAVTYITDAQYALINVSDANYYALAIPSATNGNRYGGRRYVFNLTAKANMTDINWLRYCFEGYYSNTYASVDGSQEISVKNKTGSWILFNSTTTSDAFYCINFTSNTSLNTYFNSTDGTFQIGEKLSAFFEPPKTSTTTTGYANLVNVTMNYNVTAPPSDTCTYSGSGDWWININDNCTLSSPNTISGNMYIYGSNGWLDFQANQYANAFYLNATNTFNWYYNSYRWLY